MMKLPQWAEHGIGCQLKLCCGSYHAKVIHISPVAVLHMINDMLPCSNDIIPCSIFSGMMGIIIPV